MFQKDITLARDLIMVMAIIAIFVSIIDSVWITRLFVKSIKKLTSGAELISQGNLNNEIEINSKDEFGQLSNSFNKMSKDLREIVNKIMDTTSTLGASSEQLLASA